MGVIKRRTGVRDVRRVKLSGTVTAGDTVQYSEDGDVAAGASDADVLGIALESGVDNDYIDVDIPKSGDEFEFPVETGSMTAAMVGLAANLASADGLDVVTTDKDDVILTGWDGSTATKAYGVFKELATAVGVQNT